MSSDPPNFDAQSAAGWSVEGGSPPAAAPGLGEVGSGPRYTPGGLIGRGGMGLVRVAHDAVLRREVAVKELGPAFRGNPAAAARLAREAWITAALDHPSIIAVHDAGRSEESGPFYTMRLVRGRSLDEALREASDLTGRLGLLRHLLHVAEALAVAHEAGVVHRDVKPANILIGRHGDTALVDWGLAATLHPQPGLPAEGQEGRASGTPAYLSPEQAQGAPPDPRSDVWSLGATLFTLLAGRPPRLGPSGEALMEAARTGQHDALRRVAPAAPMELVAIAERAMAAAPDQRYADAGALATDLLAWFEGRRVAAHDYSAGELLGRLWRRFRLPIGVALLGIALLSVAIALGVSRIAEERARAVAAEGFARKQLAATYVEQAVAALADDARALAERRAAAALRIVDDPLARGVLAAYFRVPRPRPEDLGAAPRCEAYDLGEAGLLCTQAAELSLWSGQPLARRWVVEHRGGRARLGAEGVEVREVLGDQVRRSFADGATVVRSALEVGPWVPIFWQGALHLPDGVWPGSRVVAPPPCPTRLQVLVASADGSRIAGLCPDGRLALIGRDEPQARVVETTVAGDREAMVGRFLPGGGQVVLAGLRGAVHLLDAQTGALLASHKSELGTIDALAVSPDGRVVALSGERGGVGLWDLVSQSWMGELPAARPRALRFEGAALLIADGRLTRWSIPSRSVGHRAVAPVGLSALAFSPDGAQLLIAGGGGYLGRVETDTGALSAAEPLGDGVVKSVAFRGDGAAAATGMAAPFLRVGGASLPGARSYRRIGFLGDGALVGLGMQAGLWWWPSQRAEPPETLGQGRAFVDLEAGDAGELWVLDAQGAVDRLRPGPLQLEPVASAPGAVAIDVAGGRLAIASANAITVRPVGGGPPVVLAAPGAGIKDIAFSFDGAYLIAGGADTIARVWRVSDGRRVAELAGHTERISALEAHPHAPLIATVSWDHSLRLWDLSALDPSPASLAAAIEASWGGGGP